MSLTKTMYALLIWVLPNHFCHEDTTGRPHLEVGGILLPARRSRRREGSGASWQDLRLQTLISSAIRLLHDMAAKHTLSWV